MHLPEIRESGFFTVVRYWLERTEHLIREDWIPYRVSLLGNYGQTLRSNARSIVFFWQKILTALLPSCVLV